MSAELPELPGILSGDDIAASAGYIRSVQLRSGAIPWFHGGHVDPWDHVECAMALTVAGHHGAAARGYRWLAGTQRADGSWPTRVRGGDVEDSIADVNHCAYIAVGVCHYTRVSGDLDLAAAMWPTVCAALDFTVDLQRERGDIPWARDAGGAVADEALLTGCASIHHSLRCGVELGELLGVPRPDWELAAARLGHVLAEHEEIFADRSRFSMDWYYPVLGGAVRGAVAARRLEARWTEFVVAGLGARCVADQPWVTGAETCELVLALDAIGESDRACELFADMQHLRDTDGSYWTGYQFAERVLWPNERSSWTAAAAILAADALAQASPGAAIFRDAGGNHAPAPTDSDACGCALRAARFELRAGAHLT